MNRKNNIKISWSPKFAYVIGILATDGNLSPDGRHISITSKDRDLILQIKKALNIKNKIGKKSRGLEKTKKYFVLQFGDKNFYEYLMSIGITPAKSKTISNLAVPKKYFYDFLRGCIDGDGNISIANHPESNKKQLRLRLASASKNFLFWIKTMIMTTSPIKGGWIYTSKRQLHMLNFGKEDSIIILKLMYSKKVEFFLKRKYSVAVDYIGRVVK